LELLEIYENAETALRDIRASREVRFDLGQRRLPPHRVIQRAAEALDLAVDETAW
jgi:hypothetical protein